MLWLLLANTWGDTPWNRPNSLRIIPKVPQNWEELMVQQYVDVRLFWDQNENAQIEMLSTRGWKNSLYGCFIWLHRSECPIEFPHFGSDYKVVFDTLLFNPSPCGTTLENYYRCITAK